MRRLVIPLVSLAILTPATAGAQDEVEEEEATEEGASAEGSIELGGAEPAGGGTVEEQQMVLPAGKLFIQAFAEINLSKDAAFEPFSIAPDIWYGVTEVLTVGLIHSGRAATGFYGPVGNGLCLTGEEGGCGKFYNSVGLDARYHFYRSGGITLSAEGGLFARSLDPFQMAIKIGAVGRWQAGSLAVELAPSIFVGLTEREPEMGEDIVIATNNKETLYLPATLLYFLSPKLALAGQAGVVVPFDQAGDLWTLAVSLGAQYMATDKIMIDAAFSLPALVAGDAIAVDGADLRSLTLGVAYAF
jgi:hypothetical protein